jgi:hypothetical protein
MNTRSAEPSEDWDLLRNPPDFSLVLGGPLFQLFRKAHLTDDALMMVRQRIIVIALLALLCRSCSTSKPTSASWWRCLC